MISLCSEVISRQISPLTKTEINNQCLVSKQLFRKQAPGFKITPENEQIIYTVFRYFLQQPDFDGFGIIKNKPDLNKGLLVYGDYGVGKSTLFDAIHGVGKVIVTRTRNT